MPGLLWLVAAHAATVEIEATVQDDLRTIEGTIAVSDGLDKHLIDPLGLLPEPPDDLNLFRTYPGAPSHGIVDFERVEDGKWSFKTRLPRRYGATGTTRKGLFANGAWYPQPLVPGGVPVVEWTVTVSLPEGVTAALGDQVGTDSLTWTGEAERVSLAAVRRGRVETLAGEGYRVELLTRGKPRKVLIKELNKQLALTAGDTRLEGAVVEASMRRRLVRPGAGLAYVSDRSFRLTPPLQRFHRVAVTRGILQSMLPESDPFERELAAAQRSKVHAKILKGTDADTLLRKFQWVPTVNYILSSRRMPFYSEILELPHPGDPVRDDLLEILDPHTAGTVIVAQIEDTFGADATRDDVPEAWLDAWKVAYPVQNYRLTVDKKAKTVTVEREAPADAPVETVTVAIDGEQYTWTADSGEHTFTLPEAPRRVVLDPSRHLGQQSRVGDAWPQRYQITLAAGVSTINLTQLRLHGTGWMTLRRVDDTHNRWIGSLYNSFNDLVGTRLTYRRKEGPLKDGFSRPHGFGITAETSLLNTRFADTDGLKVAVGSSLSYAWDTRVSGDFPLRGQRLSVHGGGGIVPGTEDFWTNAGTRAMGLVSPHPRHAFAAEGSLSIARSSVPHRLLSMGGAGSMTSLPALAACPNVDDDGERLPCQELATHRALIATEYRWAPLRNMSIPLLLAWGSELQLTGGLEAVAAQVKGEPAYAAGVTAGITGVGDVLGADSSMMGLTFGWPLWWQGIRDPDRTTLPGTSIRLPEIYLRWSQAF